MSGVWLLPAQTLLDLISRKPTAAKSWADDQLMSDFQTSVIAVAMARAKIDTLANHGARVASDSKLSALLAEIKSKAKAEPLTFTARHAENWTSFLHDEELGAIPQTARMVYATAGAEGLVVAERRHVGTDALLNRNVQLLVFGA